MPMSSDKQQRAALDRLYPSSAQKPSGPAVDATGWVELPGGGWRKLPEHLAAKPKGSKQP